MNTAKILILNSLTLYIIMWEYKHTLFLRGFIHTKKLIIDMYKSLLQCKKQLSTIQKLFFRSKKHYILSLNCQIFMTIVLKCAILSRGYIYKEQFPTAFCFFCTMMFIKMRAKLYYEWQFSVYMYIFKH